MKFTHLVLSLSIMTLAPAAASAYDCIAARDTIDRYAVENERAAQEKSVLIRQRQQLENEYNRVVADYTSDLAGANKELEKKQADFEKSVLERKKIGEEYDRTAQELRTGLYCEKCKRSKSEIERQERVSFSSHLENVKSASRTAPPELLRKAFEDYKAKRARSYQETEGIEKDIDRLDKKIVQLKVNADKKKADLRSRQSRLDFDIQTKQGTENFTVSETALMKQRMRDGQCGQ